MRFKPKLIYWTYKKFNEPIYFCELHAAEFELFSSDPSQNSDCLTATFFGPNGQHAPLNKKVIRGNYAPFMNKEFQKDI